MKERNSENIFLNIGDESEYITDLHRGAYINHSSKSIDIIRINFVILTGIIAIFSFLYGEVPQSNNMNINSFLWGSLAWLISSGLSCLVYAVSQYMINSQTKVFFKHTKPQLPRRSLSTHLFRQQFVSEVLSGCTASSFFLSFISVSLFLLSVILIPIPISMLFLIIMSIIIIFIIVMSIGISAVAFLWEEKSMVKYWFRHHGVTLDSHIIGRLKYKLSWNKDSEIFNTEEGNGFSLYLMI